jgi:hypothetical protein
LSVTQVQVLGILVELHAFMYAFSIWTSIPRSHKRSVGQRNQDGSQS